MLSIATRFATPAAASLAAIVYCSNTPAYLNDSKKRAFYEDDEEITPLPGTIVPASPTELKSLGPNTIIDSISVRSPSVIEENIKTARLATHDYYVAAQAKFQDWSQRYYKTEREITSTVSSLHEKREDLLPNSIYVIVGALTGSIVSRRRNILVRGFAPIVFGVLSFKYFLPETYKKTKGFVWKLEQQNLPQLAEQQQLAYTKAEQLAGDLEKTYVSTKDTAKSSIASTEKAITDYTGLNLKREVTKKSKD